jgi:hypothetical protein
MVMTCMGHRPDNRKKVKRRTITSSILYCIILAGLIFFSAVINPNNNSGKVITAHAQSINNNSNNSNNNNINGNNSGTVFSVNGPYSDKAPTFLDAYWTNNPSGNSSVPVATPNTPPPKTEVSPGDNVATLAVVLVNRGRSDITGVTGYLDLPADFRPIAGKNNGTSQSVAGYYSVVKAGSTFVLYFDMSVLKLAKVGGYSTSLNIKYTKILEVGELMTRITVPFRLTGKVVLNTVAKNTELTPGMPNDIRVDLQNVGTANATGVVVTVIGVTGSTVTNSGTAATTATTSANSNLSVTGASTGQQQPSSFSSIPAANLGSETFNVGTIPANGTIEINPIVYPTASAGETAQNLDVQISYGDAYGNQKAVNPQVGFIITPNPPQSVLNVTSNNENALILTAGKIQNMSFTLANNDKRPITNVVATLSSQSSSLNILGDTRWTTQTMPAQSKLNFSTKVFASASIVSQPSLFTLTVQYISAGQSKLDSLNLGAYITGEIKIRVYDLSFNKIGNIPNLVGSILNEGNTVGLFTTVEIVKQTSPTPTKRPLTDFMTSVPPSQYLGDLDADSPLPFSIPLSIDNKTMARMPPGIYPVTLKITYSDDLKIPHQLILNNIVNFQPARQPGTSEHLNFFGFDVQAVSGGIGNNFVIVAIVAAIAIVTLYIIIVRRSKARKLRTSQEEIVKEPFLDDFSSSSSSIEEGISDDARKKKKST